jgi:two-component system chemotaxis response regulator CheY
VQILVADDDRTSRLLVRASLEKLGHGALLAADGEEAWSLFSSAGPDVVITDRVMPGIDRLELCRRIRAEPRSYTYVVLLTGLTDRADVLEGMRAGADDYLIKPVDPFDLQVGLIAAERVTALHRELERYRSEQDRLNVDLAELARTDALTGLGNRLRLDEDLSQLHWRCARYGWVYSVAVCDLDRFKAYNDAQGHLGGDEALRRIAATLVETARRGDGVYRYGGEEFVIVLPSQDPEHARLAAERIRAAVEAAGPLTTSVGVATFTPGADERPETVLGRADAALYRAKHAGRNRVCE